MIKGAYGANLGNHATAAANTLVQITLPAGARQTLTGICWSYSDTPTGGQLTIMGGGWNFDVDVTQGGPGFIPFPPRMRATDNNPIVITLAAAGVGVVGKLNILGRGAD
jgi:hypothetical protein